MYMINDPKDVMPLNDLKHNDLAFSEPGTPLCPK